MSKQKSTSKSSALSPKSKCRCAPLYVAGALGLVVGAAVAHQWFICPEAKYPACYQQMVANDFSPFDGVKYDIQPKWGKQNLSLSISSNVLCAYSGALELRKVVTKPSGQAYETVFEGKLTFKDGTSEVVEIPRDKMPKDTELLLILRGDTQADRPDGFDIYEVVGSTAMYRNSLVALTAE